jgi:hypothetical protein
MDSIDRSLWITWYDLPADGRDDYLAWLHDSYMPRLLERPGIVSATHYAAEHQPQQTAKKKPRRHPPAGSVPDGYHYILIVGAANPHVFAQPVPRDFHATLPADERALLARRRGESVNIMVEEARIEGHDTAHRTSALTLSPCIQLGRFVHDDDEELLKWYAQWRMPSMTQMPGCVGVRKLVSVAGWAKHAILQEFVSLEIRNRNFVDHERKNHPDKAEWSEKVTGMVMHGPGSPTVACRIAALVK